MANWQILIVEDEPDGQELVSNLMQKMNVDTDSVPTAEEAIARLSSASYVGAVIDLALPGMDGIQLLTAIRNNPNTANLPCVAITAYHSSKVKKEVMEAGFNAYFAKPLDNSTFAKEVIEAMGAG